MAITTLNIQERFGELNMPEVARGDNVDTVYVPSHGTGCGSSSQPCCNPETITTQTCSEDTFVNNSSGGAGAVRKNDLHVSHNSITCPNHQTPLDSYSPDVYVNNRELGRKTDKYDTEGLYHVITTGSPNVWANS